VRHLFPDIEIRCLLLYDSDVSEYDSYIDLFKKFNVTLYFDRKTYNFGSSAIGSPHNGYYFTEGINKIFNITRDMECKVLILDEDQFFTTGETIRALLNNEFDLACAFWFCPAPITYEHSPAFGVNGAILAIRPAKFKNIFPLPEKYEYIETLLGHELYSPAVNEQMNIFHIPTRWHVNHYGDGLHTNDINEIIHHLKNFNIPYILKL
jgi:hypothetical protein